MKKYIFAILFFLLAQVAFGASQDFKGTINGNTITAGTGTVTVGAGKTLSVPQNLETPAIAAGDILYGSATGVLSALAKGAADSKLFMNAAGTLPEYAAGMKFGAFTYDMSTTGAASITGVGFKPSFGIFLSAIDSGWSMTVGLAGAAGGECFYNNGASSITYGGWPIAIPNTSGGHLAYATVVFDADGFTYTKSVSGTPTGTGRVKYLLFR